LDFFFQIIEVAEYVVLIFASVFLLTIAAFKLEKKQQRKRKKEYLDFQRRHRSELQAQRLRR
jgi:hypothetical protein